VEPAFGLPAKWISEDKKIMADVAGYTLIDPVSVMITHWSEIMKRYAHELLSRQDVSTMLDNVKKTNPIVVDDIIPKVISVGYLQKILANLLKEGIPIRDLETILETIGDHSNVLKDTDIITEYVRQSLKRTITHRFAEANSLRVITLDTQIEDLIVSSVKKSDQGSYLAMPPDMIQRIVTASNREIDKIKDVIPTVISGGSYLLQEAHRTVHSEHHGTFLQRDRLHRPDTGDRKHLTEHRSSSCCLNQQKEGKAWKAA